MRRFSGYAVLAASVLLAGYFAYLGFSISPISDGFGARSDKIGFLGFFNPFGDLLNRTIGNPFGNIVDEKTAKIPILIYHYVEYNDDKRDFIRDSLNVEPHVFESQIKTLKDAGYVFITPSEIQTVLDAHEQNGNKYVILSFDDGYEDFYTDVFPILKRNNTKAVNYIIYNFVGKPNYMSSSQITEIAASGLVEIGSHTLNHTSLTSVNSESAYNEISASKIGLENDYVITVTSLAYPYGFFNDGIQKMAKDAGYTTAVTVNTGNIVSSKNLYSIDRIRPGNATGSRLLGIVEK